MRKIFPRFNAKRSVRFCADEHMKKRRLLHGFSAPAPRFPGYAEKNRVLRRQKAAHESGFDAFYILRVWRLTLSLFTALARRACAA